MIGVTLKYSAVIQVPVSLARCQQEEEDHQVNNQVDNQVDNQLQLLERVFLTLGSPDTEQQLQAAINKFLSPVLKLNSQNEGMRKR